MVNEVMWPLALSGGVALFLTFVGIVWFILCVILFFKIWIMTNDIKEMRETLEEWLDIEHPRIDSEKPSNSHKN